MHPWIGKTQTILDGMDPARAVALHATLGLTEQLPKSGDYLPPFWHHIYFWAPEPAKNLGADSHPKIGTGLIPDLGLTQRMWAGGALEFLGPIVIGKPAQKVSTLENVQIKQGKSGKLCFVTLRHEILQDGVLCVSERQDLVYKELGKTPRTPVSAPENEIASITAKFDTTELFRFSALTFNGHRIHYDLDYCRENEGYPDLVVHAPLLAQKLIGMAVRESGSIEHFEFRANAPLFQFEAAKFCLGENGEMWVSGPDQRLCMTAKAT